MKTFYVLFNGYTYLQSLEEVELFGDTCYFWHPDIGGAKRFESLCQALDFNESSGLEVLRVDVTSVYTPDLRTQVVIMQSDGSQYLEKMLAHNHNAYLTPEEDEAMGFDDREKAIAFLRKCGHDVANWIIKPKQ